MKRATLLLAAVGLVSCGAERPDSTGAQLSSPPVTTTTTTSADVGASTATPTTTVPAEETVTGGAFDVSDVTIPPPDAYPVITPEQASSDDLAPGRYWIRSDAEADWPAQCLGEVIVYGTPEEGEDLPDDDFASTMETSPDGWADAELAEEISQARTRRMLELLRDYCSEFIPREVPPIVNDSGPGGPSETVAP